MEARCKTALKIPDYMGSMAQAEMQRDEGDFFKNSPTARYYALEDIITDPEDKKFLSSLLKMEG